jgi:hypothetical protein
MKFQLWDLWHLWSDVKAHLTALKPNSQPGGWILHQDSQARGHFTTINYYIIIMLLFISLSTSCAHY